MLFHTSFTLNFLEFVQAEKALTVFFFPISVVETVVNSSFEQGTAGQYA